MLSREVMGLLCLGVVWMTALLVAGAAYQDFRDLRAIARRARQALRGVVAGGDLAEWAVEQIGRATDDGAIAFHDRAFHNECFGGRIETDAGLVEVVAAKCPVWIDERAREDAAGCEDVTTYDAAHALARKAKGFTRTVRVRLRAGDAVWIVGAREGDRVTPSIVATTDPVAFATRKSLLVALFVPVELAACAAATRLALSTPHFGMTSIVGTVACMAFFLGVTPIAVTLRESVRRPHEAFLRTQWIRKHLAVRADEPAVRTTLRS
jgi:hypothetical protein